MKGNFGVYGIGNAIVDLQVRISDREFNDLGLTKGSMVLVDTKTQEELLAKVTKHDVVRASGGSVANSMIAFSLLGGRGAFGCTVGADKWGNYYIQEIEDLGVHCFSGRHSSEITGTSVILITPDAERTMNTHLGASQFYGPLDISEEGIKNSKYLFIEGYLLASDTGRVAALKAAEIAASFGTKVAITFSAAFIADVFREPLARLVQGADLVIANTDETMAFLQTDDCHEAFKGLTKLAPKVVMTMREKGAKVCFDGLEFSVPSPVVNAVDETGAGDVFAGAFLYGVNKGMEPREIATMSCFLASRVVMSMGPRLSGNVKLMLTENGIRYE